MPGVSKLVRTAKGWAETPPAACPNGHAFVAGVVQVGTQMCGGLHPGQHRTYYCTECGHVTYRPALGSACRLLHGPAGVRNV